MKSLRQQIEIRFAQSGDAPILSELFDELGFPISAQLIASRLESEHDLDECVLVALKNKAVVGVLSLNVMPVLHRPTPVGRLSALVVSHRERGCGIGRALVERGEAVLREQGCALIEVTSNRSLEQAHAFYQAIGYELTSYRFRKELA